MQIGITLKKETVVTQSITAKALNSGTLDVLSTPSMIALMEAAAYELVQPYLENGQTTVGTAIDIKHLSATPVDMKAYAVATLLEIDGRRLAFEVTAYDEKGLIGQGKHERFIINIDKFIAKTYDK